MGTKQNGLKLIPEDLSVTSGEKSPLLPFPREEVSAFLGRKKESPFYPVFSKTFLSGITQKSKSSFGERAHSSAKRNTQTTIYTSVCQVVMGR